MLLARISEPDAEKTARAYGVEGVVGLPTGVAGVIALVKPCDYSHRRIFGHLISENDHEHRAADNAGYNERIPPFVYAAEIGHDYAEQSDQYRCGNVLFEGDKPAHNADDYHIKEHHFPVRAYGFLPSVHAPRAVHYKRNLCKLGRLEQVLASDNEPALEIAVAVENKHENKKEKRDGYHEKRQVFEYPVIYSRHQEHQHNTGYGKDQLTFYIIIRIALMSVYGVDIARREQGYQSDNEQDDDEQEELCIYLPERQHFSLAAPFDAARGVSVKRIVLPEQLARRRYPRILFSCSPAFRGLSLSL